MTIAAVATGAASMAKGTSSWHGRGERKPYGNADAGEGDQQESRLRDAVAQEEARWCTNGPQNSEFMLTLNGPYRKERAYNERGNDVEEYLDQRDRGRLRRVPG